MGVLSFMIKAVRPWGADTAANHIRCARVINWKTLRVSQLSKEPICFSPYLYRARNLVERFFNKIKHCRRVATRYDKLAANYLAFIQLASIRL